MSHHRTFGLSVAVRCLALAALLLAVPGPVSSAPRDLNLVVTALTDYGEVSPSDDICESYAGGCTLRAAVETANSHSVPVTITFDPSLSGGVINLTTGAGYGTLLITGNDITIEGGYQYITIDGTALGTGDSVVRIEGNRNTLSHLVITHAPGDGIQIGNFSNRGGEQASHNTLTLLGVENNQATGIYITGANAGGHDNIIQDSQIGNRGSSIAYPNGIDGIHMDNASNNTVIRNLISGNGQAGVWISGGTAITLALNSIGTNAAKLAALPNGGDGVVITDGASNVTVGGRYGRNLISGNTLSGVALSNSAHDNLISENIIGLDHTLSAALPNGYAGIAILSSNSNQIGSSDATQDQYISGNGREGIYITGSTGNLLDRHTCIGSGFDSQPMGNGMQGIVLIDSSNTHILANLVAHNGGTGVAVTGNSTGNRIVVDDLYDNGGLPIDLGEDGFTPNGSHTGAGPNNWIEHPQVLSVNGRVVTGKACNSCGVVVYRAVGDPAQPGGGGSRAMEVAANSDGQWTATLPDWLPFANATFIAVSPSTGDTSEMAPRRRVMLPIVLRQ